MAEEKKVVPLTEPSQNQTKIPLAIFIENTEAWVEKYGLENIIQQMNELYQKYKFMEAQLIRGKESLKVKQPDIKRTLDVVLMLKEKNLKESQEEKELETNFLISDNIWAKAKIPNQDGKVGLWLGANVMVQYTFDEAIAILEKNQKNAELRLVQTDEDMNFLKDQITTTEVNMSRVYNQGVANRQKQKDESQQK